MKKGNFKKFAERRGAGIVVLMFGLVLLVLMIGSQDEKEGPITPDDLMELKGCLSQKPWITANRSSSLQIRLDEYPGLRLTSMGYFYEVTAAKELVKNANGGDSISIFVRKDDFKKWTGETPAGFAERIVSPVDLLDMYSIIYKGDDYTSLDRINEGSSRWLARSFGWAFSIILLFSGLVILFGKDTPFHKDLPRS
jgi:hypothetical protein